MHDVQDVQKLPLVFVNALDLDVEHRLRIDRDSRQVLRQLRQRELVAALHGIEAFQQAAVFIEQLQPPELSEIADPALADRFRDQRRERPIRM